MTPETPHRALAATTAAWLRASSAIVPLALLSDVTAVLHARASEAICVAAIAILLLALPERYLAWRVGFDARIFREFATGRIATTTDFDAALVAIGLRRSAPPDRALQDRVRGAMRLLRHHLAIVTSQLLLTTLMLAGLLG
jgi:hypothetical protein